MTLARMVLIFLIAAVGTTAVRGADDGINDGVDRTDPNFVTASLVIASPGEEFFSCVGHAFIRLECPTFKLDYCFSDESENVRDRVFAFLAGRLKMGMISVPTEKLLDEYRKDRRGAGRVGVADAPLSAPAHRLGVCRHRRRLHRLLCEAGV